MTFAGNKKVGKPLLHNVEQYLVKRYIDKIPKYIETWHLTYSTFYWSMGIILFSTLAAKVNIHWLWAVSVMIVLQYFTDLFDGAVGRHRNTGLIRWGYYMDHFLDYIFLCAILIGYAILMPIEYKLYLLLILALFSGFMVNSFLAFAASNEFKIAYAGIGPTEIRILFIIINTLLIIFGKTYMIYALPFVLTGATIGLLIVIFRTQKTLWNIDMKEQKSKSKK